MKEKPALRKMAEAFCENYRRLGHFGGTYYVSEETRPEALKSLSAFLREDVRPGRKITWKQCLRAWEETRFAAVMLDDICAALSPRELVSRPAQRQARRERQAAVLSKLAERYGRSSRAARWLAFLQKPTIRHRLPKREYALDESLLETVARALAALPEQYERLPFFANRVTGNPHALDESEAAGRIFLQALGWLKEAEDEAQEGGGLSAEGRTDLLYHFHLLRDDVQNFVTVYGIVPAGRTDTYYHHAADEFAPLNLPLREIIRFDAFVPINGSNDVYIVENSGVFSSLLDDLAAMHVRAPLLCLHGQLKLASWAMLDRLTEGGARLHYSGDYDPEGLMIADKILKRYPAASPWHFQVDEYAPKTKEKISSARLKQLSEISSAVLKPVADAIRARGCAYYQESFKEQLKQDLLK